MSEKHFHSTLLLIHNRNHTRFLNFKLIHPSNQKDFVSLATIKKICTLHDRWSVSSILLYNVSGRQMSSKYRLERELKSSTIRMCQKKIY